MSTQSRIAAEAQKDPETLEREIDQQRESISSIVHELENKLSPGELLDRALRYAKGNGGEFFGNLGETVKANPVPTLLTALGLTWLMMGQNRSAPASGHASLSGQAAGAKRQAQHLKDKAGQVVLGPAVTDVIAVPGAAGDAVSALVNLGYRRAEAFAAVAKATQAKDSASVQELIRAGLRELGR